MKPRGSCPTRDTAWFDEMYHHTFRQVYGYVYRRVPGSCDDIVSEVFLTAWRRRDDIPETPLPWLYGVARVKVMEAKRKYASSSTATSHIMHTTDATHPDHSDAVINRMAAATDIDRLLQQLKPEDREVLTLWSWEQLDTSGIAEVLGLSMIAVRARLRRARKRAAVILNTTDNTSDAAASSAASSKGH